MTREKVKASATLRGAVGSVVRAVYRRFQSVPMAEGRSGGTLFRVVIVETRGGVVIRVTRRGMPGPSTALADPNARPVCAATSPVI